MAVHGSTWQYKVVRGNTNLCCCQLTRSYLHAACTQYMAVHGSAWLYMAVQSCAWQYKAVLSIDPQLIDPQLIDPQLIDPQLLACRVHAYVSVQSAHACVLVHTAVRV